MDLTIQVLPGVRGTDDYCGMMPVVVHLRRNRAALPNLRTLAIQALQRQRSLAQSRWDPVYSFGPEIEWRWQWFVVELKEIFWDRVQIVFEGWIVLRAGHPTITGGHDEMMRIRGVVGNCGEGCRCTFEMASNAMVGGLGPWTNYWQAKKMGYDREHSLSRAGGRKYDKSEVVRRRHIVNYWRQQRSEMLEDLNRLDRGIRRRYDLCILYRT